MPLDPTLVELLIAHKMAGMQPSAAAAALMAASRTAPPQDLQAGPIEPADLALALAAAFGAGLTAAELASILHAEYPQMSAVDIAQTVLGALPATSEPELLAALTGCGIAPVDAQGAVNIMFPATVTIQSNQAWQVTGVEVTGQQSTAIACSGLWTANPANGMCGPDGTSFFIAKDGYTLPGAAEGAMIGQIGSNPPFLVGSTRTAPAGQSGMLSLCINDDLHGRYGAGLTDNVGSMSATITTSA